MFYYKVKSSHWPMELEFKSELKLPEGTCFRIREHDGYRDYPTRFKVLEAYDAPKYSGKLVEIKSVYMDVEKF